MLKKFFHFMSVGLVIFVQQGFNGTVIGMDNQNEMSEEGFNKAISHLTSHKNQIKHATEFQANYQKQEKGIQEFVLTPTCIACFYMGYSANEPKNCENRKKFKEVGLYEGEKHSDPYPPRLIERNLIEEEGSVIQVAEDCPACLNAYNYVYNYRKNAREKEKNELKSLKENQEITKKEFEILSSQFQLFQKETNNTKETEKIELEKITLQIQLLEQENKKMSELTNVELEKLNSQVQFLEQESKNMKEDQEKNKFDSKISLPSEEEFTKELALTEKIEKLFKVTSSILEQLNKTNKNN
jgi:hypothetical protein